MPREARVLLNGLTELIDQLRDLPEALWQEGGVIVSGEATMAYQAMDAATPEVSGNLRDHLTIDNSTSGIGRPRALVKNRAHHAWIWEHGSKGPRKGGTGVMPRANKYIPIAMQHREMMRDRLIAMVERHGLQVKR